jgi:hypothetical protein
MNLNLKLASVLTIIMACASTVSSTAQQKEIFHGSELRTAHGSGVTVSATRRSSGEEILRIRTNRTAIEAFLTEPLPREIQGGASRNYRFELQISPPLFQRKECVLYPSSRSEFEACFSGSPSQRRGAWMFIPLKSNLADMAKFGFKSANGPETFATCGFVLADRQLAGCQFYFEDGGHWHELSTSPVALDHIQQFRCASLQLRNSIWADAPKIPDECRT